MQRPDQFVQGRDRGDVDTACGLFFFILLRLPLSQVSLWGKTEKSLQTTNQKNFMVSATTVVQLFILF